MSKRSSLFLLLLIVSMSVLSFPTSSIVTDTSTTLDSDNILSTTVSARILIDESHVATDTELWTPGNASRFGALLMHYGHSVDTNFDASFDSGVLDSYDILMLFFPQVELTSAEVQAIEDFVDNGGHLLLVGIDNRPNVGNYTSQPLNAISETYGITFNEDAYFGRGLRSDGTWTEHHLSYSIDSIVGRAGNFLQSCSLTLTSPAISLGTAQGYDFGAVAEVGDSKIVAIGSAAPFLELGRDSLRINDDDHHQFVLNIIDWMLGEPERIVEIPEENVITVGQGPDLNETEVEEYQMFTGIIHDHTTYSDGDDSAEAMTLAAIEAQLDFMVMTDHSWENPGLTGIHGALACRDLVTRYGLDILIGIGAELSNGQHVVGFPMTENIWSGDMQEKVDGLHAQGAIAILAHPLLGQGYIEPWDNYDIYGYDAFEVMNTDYFYGEGESAFYRPFVAASDGHAASFVGNTLNAIFVKNPSGPNGTLSIEDVADAVLDRRLVALSKPLKVVLGEEVWVNRYLDLRESAETAVDDAEEAFDLAQSEGAEAFLSSAYLDAAQAALENMNPTRAIRHATTSQSFLDLDIIIDDSELDGATPNENIALGLDVENGLDYDVSLNVTPFFYTAISFDSQSILLEAAAETSEENVLTGTVESFGYTRIYLNIDDITPSSTNRHVVLSLGGIVANVSEEVIQVTGGYNASIHLFKNFLDSRYITSVEIEYGTDDGSTTSIMVDQGDRYSITIGPYPGSTNVTYSITVNDRLGNSFTLSERTITIESTGLVLDSMTMLVVGGIAIGIIALVIVVVKFRR